jgi:hypothetical protein
MSLRWFNVLLGAWLLVIGIVMGPGTPAFGDHLFLGLAIFLVSFLAMGIPQLRALNVALGAWTVLSPFVFGYEQGGRLALNDIVVGILVVWVASTAPRPRRREDDHAHARIA